jgi:putative hydrolase of the HAD superfamily
MRERVTENPLATVPLPWADIDTVLLDMDGTLLDLHFDYHFWMEYVPQKYAEKQGLPLEEASRVIREKIHSQTGTLNWYCLDYWQEQLALPIVELKHELKHLIAEHPEVIRFLTGLQKLGKQVIMVTNAHRDSLAIKLECTEIGDYFDAMHSSHDFGLPKEASSLWSHIQTQTPYDPKRTLLIDDNLTALRSARDYGIAHLLCAVHVSPKLEAVDPEEFQGFEHFSQIMPSQ